MVREYGDKVRYRDENFGASPLAERYGVTRYPAVFVDEALIARPQDFHLWEKTQKGKYTPWLDDASHERFQADLRRMIDLRLRGERVEALEVDAAQQAEIQQLPEFEARDLEGKAIRSQDLAGRLVLVEFWATWCPPCRKTLSWLGEVEERFGDGLSVLAVAIASQEAQVRQLASSWKLPARVVLGQDELVQSFGTVMAVPTLFLFDRQGRTISVFYGAPDDLHERLESLIEEHLQE